MAQQEIEELRDSLRYAEYLLQKTRQEKASVEAELAGHDQRILEVKSQVRAKEAENRLLEQQIEDLGGQALFA